MPASPHEDHSTDEQTLRREAADILFASGIRLTGLLSRIAGEDGLALGWAFVDIALDRDMPPTSWPISEVLEILATADTRGDRSAAALRADLSRLMWRIDALEAGSPMNDSEVTAVAKLRTHPRVPSQRSGANSGEEMVSKARLDHRIRSGRAA